MPAGSTTRLPLHDQADPRAGVAGGVDELRQLVEPRLRRAVGLAGDVLAQHAEQSPRLRERVAGRHGDRLEPAAGVRREPWRRQSRGLALHRDHGEVVGDDVVQLAGDPGALLHRGLLALAHRHPLLRRGERVDDLRPPPRRLADDHRSDDEEEGHHAREPRGSAVERDGGVEEERQRERGAVHEAAAGNEVARQVEEHADRGDRQRRLPGAEQHEDAERGRAGREEREPGGDQERRDRQHVEGDGQRRVPLLLEREALVDVRGVDARLQRRDNGEGERQGDPAVPSREHTLRHDERALTVPDELHGSHCRDRRSTPRRA